MKTFSMLSFFATPDYRITIMSRFHDSADIMITILKETNFAFNTRIAVFSVACLQLQRLCIVAEEQPDSYDERIYAWMNKVMAIVNQRHHESVFLIATVAPGTIRFSIQNNLIKT